MRPLRILGLQLGNRHSRRDAFGLGRGGFSNRDSLSWAYVSYEPGTFNDGLYYVASFVMDQIPNAQVDVCQMLWGEDPADFPLESYDYVLISGLGTHFWSNLPALELVKSRKRAGAKTIMGGPHATFAPYEVLDYVDFAILGEGEVPTVQLIACLESQGDLSTVHNLCWVADDGALTMNPVHRYGSLGTLIDPRLLRNAPPLPWAPISMSRGCPYNCSFCYAIRLLGRQFRNKEAGDIRREADAIAKQTGCRRFLVTDLNFATRKEFCHSVAAALRGGGYKLIALTRITLADDVELVEDLKASGFDEYYFGVESEDAEVLDSFNKSVEASGQTAQLHTMAEHDVFVHAGLIFGAEAQDQGAMERTARWCAEARIIQPNFYCIANYPFQRILYGSHQDVEDHRIILRYPHYQHYSYVGIFPRHMRPSELQRALVRCTDIFFERAFEIEKRPKRLVRLKAFARLKASEKSEVDRHIEMLERIERPYYSSSGALKENLLKADFDGRYGHIARWVERSMKPGSSQLAQLPA